jgi:hypothetical protein
MEGGNASGLHFVKGNPNAAIGSAGAVGFSPMFGGGGSVWKFQHVAGMVISRNFKNLC